MSDIYLVQVPQTGYRFTYRISFSFSAQIQAPPMIDLCLFRPDALSISSRPVSSPFRPRLELASAAAHAQEQAFAKTDGTRAL